MQAPRRCRCHPPHWIGSAITETKDGRYRSSVKHSVDQRTHGLLQARWGMSPPTNNATMKPAIEKWTMRAVASGMATAILTENAYPHTVAAYR
jgi:hypothetical protein